MKYTLTKDDLKTLGNGIRNANSMSVEEHLDAFLAYKPTDDWQVIASGEVKGEKGFFVREFSIGENSIGSVCSKICKYDGKDIEIAVRVKE